LKVQGIPPFSKDFSVAVGALLGALIFHPNQFLTFRPRWFDIPMLAFLISPSLASLTNDLGEYDAFSAFFQYLTFWGFAYVLGRVFFSSLPAVEELAIAFATAGLIYVPLCLWEVRMSPQLHAQIYGFIPYVSITAWGFIPGYRPNVFMGNGLLVGVFMACATIAMFWLWQTRAVRRVMGIPTGWAFLILYITTIFCKVLGAWSLMHLALLVLICVKYLRLRTAVLALLLAPSIYVIARTTATWDAQLLVEAASHVHAERAGSIGFRLENENLLIKKAMQRPLFGWGGFGRSRVHDEESGQDISVTDGLWIIVIGQEGLFGLCAWLTAMALPALLLWRRARSPMWRSREMAFCVGLAMIICISALDNLFNASFGQIIAICLGGLTGVAGNLGKRIPLSELEPVQEEWTPPQQAWPVLVNSMPVRMR
jgi:hypothetical protein